MNEEVLRTFNLKGLNLRLNPFLQENGDLIRAVNIDTDFIGAKVKRAGYYKLLGTPDNAQVNTIFDWHKANGTQFWMYRASGSSLYYSTQGTGAWTICGNGTIANGGHVGYAVLEDQLIIGDGTTNTRVTSNGTSFTDAFGAPKASTFAEYQQRIWASGTSSDVFYSTTGTPSDWTTDSSSIRIPGAGNVSLLFKQNDRLQAAKNSQSLFKYDGNTLWDVATNQGPSSPYSIGNTEDKRMWLNRNGVILYEGLQPQIFSNSVERLIFNSLGSGVAGTQFDSAPGVTHRYDYFVTLGTVTDDFTGETIINATLKYNFLTDEYVVWSTFVQPTAWHSYVDNNRNVQLVFGAANGQVYQFDLLAGTAQSDDGQPIEVQMGGVLHYGKPDLDKEFKRTKVFFNPGANAVVQTAVADTFTKGKLPWQDVGDAVNGVAEHRFPEGDNNRGRLRFWKIREASRSAPFRCYGFVDTVVFISDST